MTTAISEIHSEIFRGGGLYKKSIFESLVETFRSGEFTYRQANDQITEFNRSTCRDFLEAGLIKYENRMTYPYYYRVHLSPQMHKLTRKEIIERKMKRTRARGVAA